MGRARLQSSSTLLLLLLLFSWRWRRWYPSINQSINAQVSSVQRNREPNYRHQKTLDIPSAGPFLGVTPTLGRKILFGFNSCSCSTDRIWYYMNNPAGRGGRREERIILRARLNTKPSGSVCIRTTQREPASRQAPEWKVLFSAVNVESTPPWGVLRVLSVTGCSFCGEIPY